MTYHSIPNTRSLQRWKSFLFPKLHRIAGFLSSQGITTLGNLLYGFLCVRLLPIGDYAEFAVVFGFLGTLTVLMDIGISSTLLPLVGERIDDRQLIADYIASLRQLAHWLYVAVTPLIIFVYPIMVRRQDWNWRVVAGMVVILLVACWSARVSGAYGAVLIVRRDLAVWYRIQMISSLGTLFLLGVVWPLHWLNAISAILINVAGIVFTAAANYIRAQRLLGVKGHPSKEKRQAIVHLAMPSMPNTIFYAFQGQISLLLITWFGHSNAVAGLGALNRLSRFFVLFAQMNPLLIEPYFAKLPAARLKRNYLGLIAVEGAFCLLMTAMAAFFPELFLWILGPKYSNLRTEVLLLIAASSVGHLAEVMWTVHASRRFIYWWNGTITIVYTLAIEIVFIWKMDLSTVRSVLIMNLATIGGVLLINALTGIYGFLCGPRQTAGMVVALQQEGPYE
jgi:O-antigen/teichoic acid export membrane protein